MESFSSYVLWLFICKCTSCDFLEDSSWCTLSKNSVKPRLMQSVLSTSWEIPHKFYEKAYKQVDGFHQVGFLVCGDLSDFLKNFSFQPCDSAKTWLGKLFHLKLRIHYHLKVNFGTFYQVHNLLPFIWSKGQASLSFWRKQRHFLLFWLN